MKKSNISYDEIVSYEVIEDNYKNICSKTKHKEKILKFDLFHSVNINSIFNDLKARSYEHSNFNIFLIKEPKYRIVMSEVVKDKIVNHLVSNVFLKPVLFPKLITENVATREGKGTAAAIELCKKYYLRMLNKYGEFYILKFDISKYFYNIDHEVLKQMLRDVYTDKEVLAILYKIIDSTDEPYINEKIEKCITNQIERISKLNEKDFAAQHKELMKIPRYKKGKGLGIGSLTSQVFAVYYLNGLDHFIKENLGIKEYIRYMDDGIIFSNDKSELKKIKKIVEQKLAELKLTLNEKTAIYSSKGGMDFVGYRFIIKNGRLLIRLKNATKYRMKKKFNILEKHDKEKYEHVKASYNGLMQYCTTKSLYQKLFKTVEKEEQL